MSFPRYPSYKDSDVGWLGEVPAHWDVQPLYSSVVERNEPNKGMVEDNLLSLSYGRIVQKDITSNDGLLPESFETYQVVRPGDIVFRLTDLQNDKRSLRSAIVEETGIITSAYLAVVPRGPDSKYMSYLFRAYDVTKVFYSMGGGLRQSMKFADLKRMPTLLPSPEEQVAIATFLDRETAKIDALVAEQRRLVELLKEKRQAVISNAVTQGLNPDAPMKPSGIEWLGDVPVHWRTTKLKFVTEFIVDCPHETPTYSEDGEYLVIRTADLDEGRIDDSMMFRVSEPEYLNRIRRASLLDGDIVYGREGERWGHAALVKESGRFCLGQRMMQFRASEGVCPEYLMWALNAEATYLQGQLDTVGATSPHVNVWTIRNYDLAHPPIEEQRKIGSFLGRQTRQFDTLTAEAQRAIDLLQEHRTALISAAVTGQIDVRALTEREAA